MSMQGAQVEFKAGTLIFKEGDPGGDLYFIKAGEIEVFRETQGVHVPLAMLKAGEVLGIMTCLTREPRLASARAATDVVAMVVKQAGIRTLIQSTPAWVNTVIKDFIVRVKNLDDLYARAVARLEQEDHFLSRVRLCSMMAIGLGEMGELLAPGGYHAVVDVDAVLERLARIYDVPRRALDELMGVMAEVGLVKIDPEATAVRAELGVLRRLSGFAETVRRYLAPERRLAFDALTPRDHSYLSQLYEELRTRQIALGNEGSFPLSRLVFGEHAAEFVAGVVERAAAAGIWRVAAPAASEAAVAFVPQALLTTVRGLEAIRRLRELDAERYSDPVEVAAEVSATAAALVESY